MGAKVREPIQKAITILYSEAPYTNWKLIVKTAHYFDNDTNEIVALSSMVFNHVRNHFDAVMQVYRSKAVPVIKFLLF